MTKLAEEYHHVHSLVLKLIISLLIYVIFRDVHRQEVFLLSVLSAWPVTKHAVLLSQQYHRKYCKSDVKHKESIR